MENKIELRMMDNGDGTSVLIVSGPSPAVGRVCEFLIASLAEDPEEILEGEPEEDPDEGFIG